MQYLEMGVQDFLDGDQARYQEFLKVMTKFYSYSLNNTLLIAMQRPDTALCNHWISMWKARKRMSKIYFTLTGTKYYHGNEFLKPGMKLKKEPDNKCDKEAIIVKMESLGEISHVANSTHTVIGEIMSVVRIYNKIDDTEKVKVVLVTEHGTICRLDKKSLLNKKHKKAEETINE